MATQTTKATRDDKDDVPKGQKDAEPKMMKPGKEKRAGSKDDETPLPEGFYEEDEELVEADDAEDQEPGEKARSSKDDEEIRKEAEAEEDARYQRRLELLIQQDEKIQKAKIEKDEKSRRDPKEVALKVEDANGEALAEGQAVGKAEAGSKEQSPKRQSAKTPEKTRMMIKDEEKDISPIIKRMVNEEVEKRLKATQSVTKR